MGEKDQADAESIEKRLKMPFLKGTFEAYNKLRKVTWTGEPVDVYAAEIRWLAGLVGYTGQSLEKTVKMAFMSSFPDGISMELQQLVRIENMEVEEVLRHARVLAKQTGQLGAVATSTKSELGKGEQTVRRLSRKFIGKCFRCQEPQLMRDCKESRQDVTCFRYGQVGHISRYCPPPQGNKWRGVIAPVATPLIPKRRMRVCCHR